MSHFPKPVDVLHYTVRDFVNMSTITVLEMGGLSRWAQSNTRALTSGEHFLAKIRRRKSEAKDGSERCPSVTWRDRGLWSKPQAQPLDANSQRGRGYISVLQLHETGFCQKSEWLEAHSSPESPVNNADSWHLDFSLWHPEWRKPAEPTGLLTYRTVK